MLILEAKREKEAMSQIGVDPVELATLALLAILSVSGMCLADEMSS